MKLYSILALLFLSFNTVASMNAITDEGDVVILNDDGTWLYEEDHTASYTEITTNPREFTKPDSSNFVLKSKVTQSTFAIDSELWTFSKITDEDSAGEYSFELKKSDLYGKVITEEISFDIEALAEASLENAQKFSPNAKIVNIEYRVVNGKKVLFTKMVMTLKGAKFNFFGYFYSDSSGSTQYFVYTSENLVAKYRNEIDGFLNGFSVKS